jgi:hypothetical protein
MNRKTKKKIVDNLYLVVPMIVGGRVLGLWMHYDAPLDLLILVGIWVALVMVRDFVEISERDDG